MATSSKTAMVIDAPPVSVPVVAHLFRKLSVEFGPVWDGRLGSVAAMEFARGEWWQQVHDLTPEQVRQALDTMPVGQGAFPPGPRAFRRLALAQPEVAPPARRLLPRAQPHVVPDAAGVARVRATMAAARAELADYAAERGVSL